MPRPMTHIVELYGYSPEDTSPAAQQARAAHQCPFTSGPCVSAFRDAVFSGACTIATPRAGPVICCPIRLEANNLQLLTAVSTVAFGSALPLIPAGSLRSFSAEHIVVFRKNRQRELRTSTTAPRQTYAFDWILARINDAGQLTEFIAVETPTVAMRHCDRAAGKNMAQPKWHLLNNAILPRLIAKGQLLKKEPLCLKGVFLICHASMYRNLLQRLGGTPPTYPLQPGTLTMLSYDLGPPVPAGHVRDLMYLERLTTTVDHVALALSASLKPPSLRFYENAIRAELC